MTYPTTLDPTPWDPQQGVPMCLSTVRPRIQCLDQGDMMRYDEIPLTTPSNLNGKHDVLNHWRLLFSLKAIYIFCYHSASSLLLLRGCVGLARSSWENEDCLNGLWACLRTIEKTIYIYYIIIKIHVKLISDLMINLFLPVAACFHRKSIFWGAGGWLWFCQ